ncbi:MULTISPECIES: pilus (MSHA type) biogenesis protein MshL [Shewanella]|uniref:Pilus (MSHA type) biogenesis protein MshL n=1 Tax=Shewanella baltica (strain OS155 / ATCC BAA-1091) TaxID=325240 RepID=A3D993_SHEB5|nr:MULTISPECIES: pilus (MSHA type) biogenesis protein MshL [Shewanella]ABN63306.1 pilus (MSHA type) biogenesis protein MshL [Shewanella baltica OS155]ACK45042.1 pilus (MSHA type) biogenesis protein MshL [Shewanella baltica OS223]AEH15654.1 pilus (MSHA type) biogenesis protein MshL [Shewanella baltica OS117]AVT47199.1 pilus (MSHA type) biogenesis protein MshL [Shewanella baltica]MCS6097237.1 pilus (MSHA type) biogenesis protein MshL [Shewanella baltica]
MKAIKYFTPLLSLCLVACQTTNRPQPEASKAELAASMATATASTTPPPATMPDAVQRELNSGALLSGLTPALETERRFDVSAHDVDAKVFFPSLVQGTPLSVAVHPDVQGTISLSLKGVTLSEAIQVVEDIYGYEVSREGRILRVFPAGMRTETFPLNYLYMERDGLSVTSVSSGRISDSNNSNSNSSNNNSNNSGSSNNNSNSSNGSNSSSNGSSDSSNGTFIRSRTKTDFWGELKETLTAIIGDTGNGRQVVVTPQAGLVTIRAFPSELRQVRTFLNSAESHLQRQVILEAKIIEVTLSDGYQQGIQWDNVLGHVGNTNVNFGTSKGPGLSDKITSAIGGVTSLSIKGSDFTTMINLLDTQGDVDVLSSPRVTASNNQKAVIKVGTDEYFVTDVSSTTVGGTPPVTTPQVELTPFFSGIALDVTPQIDSDGNVLLHVHPSVIDVKEQTKDIKVSDASLELPLAQSEIRESDTVIRAASGDVVIIGGLMKSESIEVVSQVPLLGDIPYLGELFKNRSKQKKKTELIILLKPTVVGVDTWKTELQRSKTLLDRWYPETK